MRKGKNESFAFTGTAENRHEHIECRGQTKGLRLRPRHRLIGNQSLIGKSLPNCPFPQAFQPFQCVPFYVAFVQPERWIR